MESLLESVFSKYLREYILNYRKENFSMQFLRGEGGLRDFDIDCNPINAMLGANLPALTFTRIYVTKLSVRAQYTKLKTKPIELLIDEIYVEVMEPVHVDTEPPAPSSPPQPSPKPSKYGLVERVLDSVTVHINKLHLHIRTLGKLKCEPIGPWTPPVIEIILEHVKYCSTDPNGEALPLEDCFERSPAPEGQIVIHKRLHAQVAHAYIINPNRYAEVLKEQKLQNYFTCRAQSTESTAPATSDPNRTYRRLKLFTTSLHIAFAFRKRLSDCALLALELEFLVPDIIVALKPWVAQELIHSILGVCYALWREQAVRRIYGPFPYGEPSSPTVASSLGTPHSPPAGPRARVVLATRLQNVDITMYSETEDHSKPSGVRLVVVEFLYELLMTEDMAFTESVAQLLIQKMFVNEVYGRRNMCIAQGIRDDGLMSAATPILLDRGVIPFETKCYDIDQQAFVMKMVTNWPPPPIPAVGSRIEASLTPIAIHLEPYPILKAIESFNSVWDPRHLTGQWGLPPGTDHLVERQIGVGTSELLLRVAGVQVTLPPPTGINPATSCPWSSSIPQLTLSCSQISVFVSSSLNVTIPQSAITVPSSNSGADQLVAPQLVGKLLNQTYDGCSLLPYRMQVAVECIQLSMSRGDGKPAGYPLLSVAAVTFGSFGELHPDVLHSHRQANVPHDAYSRMFYVPSGRSSVAVTTLYAQGVQAQIAPARALWAFENVDAYRVILASKSKQPEAARLSEPAQPYEQRSSSVLHVQVADFTVELLDDMDELGYKHPNANGLMPVMSIHSEKLEFVQEQDLYSAASAQVINLSTNSVLVSSGQRTILLLTTGQQSGSAGVNVVLKTPPEGEDSSLHWLARLGKGACGAEDIHSRRPSLFVSLATTCDDEEFLHRYLVHAVPDCVLALHPEALSELARVLTRIAAYDVSTALGTVLQSRSLAEHVRVVSQSLVPPQAPVSVVDGTQASVAPSTVHARQFRVAVQNAHLFVFSAFGGAYHFECVHVTTEGDKFPDADPELDGMGFGKVEIASRLKLAYARSVAEPQPLFETLTDAIEVRMSAKRAAVDPNTPLSPISAAQPYHWSINWNIPDAVLNFSNVHRRALFEIVDLVRAAIADIVKLMVGDATTATRKDIPGLASHPPEQVALFHGAEDVSGLMGQIQAALDDVLTQCRSTKDLLRATSATALTSLQQDAIAVEHLAELVRMTRNEVAVLRAMVDANHCGWLRRSDGSLSARVKRRSARRYWAVLKGQTLFLLANPGSREILEAIDLHSRYACDVEAQHTEFLLVDRHGRKTRFIADDLESKLGWLDVLPKARPPPRSPATDAGDSDARSVVEESVIVDGAADDALSTTKASRQKRLSLRKTVHAVSAFKNTLTRHLHIRTHSSTLSITTDPSPREEPPAREQSAQARPTVKPSLRIDTRDRELVAAAALRNKFSSDDDSEPPSPRDNNEDGQHTASSQPASGEATPAPGLDRLVRTGSARSKAPSHTDDSVSDRGSTCLDIDEVASYFHSEIDRTMHLSASVTSQVGEHRALLESNHYDVERDVAAFESKLKNMHVLMHALRFKLMNACKEFAQREASQQAVINELRRLLHEERLRVAELEKQLARAARQRDAAEFDLKQYAQRQMRRIQKLEDENDALKMVLSDEHWRALAERQRPPPATTPVSATSMSQLQELVKQLTMTVAEQKQVQRELQENVEMATEETRLHRHLAHAAEVATKAIAEEQATNERYLRGQIAQLQQSLQAEVLRRQAAELLTEDLRASLDAMVALAGSQLRPSS